MSGGAPHISLKSLFFFVLFFFCFFQVERQCRRREKGQCRRVEEETDGENICNIPKPTKQDTLKNWALTVLLLEKTINGMMKVMTLT